MDKYYVYGVNFKDNGKVYNFKSSFKCPLNVTVITETEKGEQFGKVVGTNWWRWLYRTKRDI